MAGLVVPPPPPPPPPPPSLSFLPSSGSSTQLLAPGNPSHAGTKGDGLPAQQYQSPEDNSGVKPWERPWGTRDLRENAGKWSLAGDSGLLLYLRDFSQRMIQRTHDIERQVDDLVSDVKTSSVKAHNVFNEFVVLANTQFVENRVYEEDLNVEAQPQKPEEKKDKSREEVESDLVPKVVQAVLLGLEVLDKAFDKLDPHVEGDSEDDEPYQGDALYEPKDPYADRPLPYLIGSTQFNESDDIGLRERPPEDVASDHGSISESEEELSLTQGVPSAARQMLPSELSSGVSDSEEDDESDSGSEPAKQRPTAAFPAARVPQDEQSDESDGDLFQNDASEGDDDDVTQQFDSAKENMKPKMTPQPLDIASELARKFGVTPSGRQHSASGNSDAEPERTDAAASTPGDSSNQKKKAGKKQEVNNIDKEPAKQKSKAKHRDSEDDLFKPAASDEDDAWIGSKPGLFSEGARSSLFGDDDGLFSSVAEGSKSASSKIAPPEKDMPAIIAAPPAATAKAKGVQPSKGPFDKDDDDDLFAPPAFPKGARESTSRGSVSQQSGSVGKTANPTAVPGKNDAADAFGSKDSAGDDLFVEKPIAEKPTAAASSGDKPTEPVTTRKLPAGAVSLFPNQPNPFTASKAARQPSDDEDEAADGFATAEDSLHPKFAVKSARSGSKSESKEVSVKTAPPKSGASKVSAAAGALKPNGTPQKSIFDDDDDDNDLFATMTMPKKSDPAKKASTLIMDPEGSIQPHPSEVKAEPAIASARAGSKKPPVISLFDGEDGDGDEDDDDNLFSGMGKKPTPPPVKAAAKSVVEAGRSSSFGKGGEEANLDDDLFSRPATQVTAKTKAGQEASSASKFVAPKQQQQPPVTRSTAATSDLFGSEDESDDLFAVRSSKNASSTKANAGIKSTSKETSTRLADVDPLFGSDKGATSAARNLPQSTSASSTFKESPLKLDDEGTDDLFPDVKAAKPSPTVSQAPSTAKKPAGAVAMSPGLDTGSIIKEAPVLKDDASNDNVDPLSTGTKASTSKVQVQQQQVQESGRRAEATEDNNKVPAKDSGRPAPTHGAGEVAKLDATKESKALNQESISDEDDLFSTRTTAKVAELPSSMAKKFAGAVPVMPVLDPPTLLGKNPATTTSRDTPPAATSSDAVGTLAISKAAGSTEDNGASLTGLDVTSAVIKSSTPASVSPAKNASKLVTPFTSTRGDSSDEDMFAPRPASAAKQPASSSKSLAAAGSALPSGLFGSPDDSDLFGFGSKQPSSQLDFEPSVSSKQEAKLSAAASTLKTTDDAQISKGVADPPSKVRDMFEDDEDDLFGVTTKPSMPSAMPKSQGTMPAKKPVGGISMFGGLNPASLLKGKGPMQAKTDVAPIDAFGKDNDDLFGTATTVHAEVQASVTLPPKKPASDVPSSSFNTMQAAAAATSHVARVISNSRSDSKKTIAEAQSPGDDLFSHVASAEGALTGPSKSRARMQQKRRPQSREARLLAVTLSAANADKVDDAEDDPLASVEKKNAAITVSLPTAAFSADQRYAPALPQAAWSEGKVALAGVASLTLSASPLFKQAKNSWDPDATTDDANDDLFVPPANKKVTTSKPTSIIVEEPVITSKSASADATFSSASKIKDIFGKDDLFADSGASTNSSAKDARVVATSAAAKGKAASAAAADSLLSSDPLADDVVTYPTAAHLGKSKLPDLEPESSASAIANTKDASMNLVTDHSDLFGSNSQPAKQSLVATTNNDDDDDDIFADASILKGSSTVKQVVNLTAVKIAIDEASKDDGATAGDAKKSSKKAAKAITKVEDMFADDTDIFSDLPSLPKIVTSKPKKPMGSTSSKKKTEQSTFEDNGDDIFAPTAKKPSKPHGKPKAKAASTTSSSIKKTDKDFVDPLAAD